MPVEHYLCKKFNDYHSDDLDILFFEVPSCKIPSSNYIISTRHYKKGWRIMSRSLRQLESCYEYNRKKFFCQYKELPKIIKLNNLGGFSEC